MPLYVYRCELGHETNVSRPMELMERCPPCRGCHQPTIRVLYPGIMHDLKRSQRKARNSDAGKRLLDSEYGDPQRRKQYFTR